MEDKTTHPIEQLNLPEPVVDIRAPQAETASVRDVMNELSGAKKAEQPATFSPQVTQPTSTSVSTPPVVPVDEGHAAVSPVAHSSVATPAIADDNDLIEAEWVQKAKAIIDRTKDDPHTQNQEIGQYKADYMKKRFNKDIKVAES